MNPPDKSSPMFFYEHFADKFDSVVHMYDTRRRVEIVFDQLLPGICKGKKLLDAGCGTGWFSQRACEEGADVTSLDVGPRLLGETAKKCDSTRVVGSVCELPFPDDTFDLVVSSEVIEHTPDPKKAVEELIRVAKPGGKIVITVPHRVWIFALYIANFLKIRPYQGLENWVWWGSLRKWSKPAGGIVEDQFGFHLIPNLPITWGQKPLFKFLRFCDRGGRWLGPLMVNIAVLVRKEEK